LKRFASLLPRTVGAAAAMAAVTALAVWPVRGGLLLVAACSLVAALAAVEGLRMMHPPSGTILRLLTGLSAAGCAAAVALGSGFAPVLALLPGLPPLTARVLAGDNAGAGRCAGAGWIASVAAVSLGLLARMRLEQGLWIFFLPLFVCWFGDTAAYLAGSAFGRRRMCPAVSPSKTWEGFGAGLAGSCAGALVAGTVGAGLPAALSIAAGLLGGAAGALSDLLESSLKRDSGLKDSGSFIPGHGGVLDRIDSLGAAVPVIWVMLALAGVPA
jgi:phosphatidate cytidylyltransferase